MISNNPFWLHTIGVKKTSEGRIKNKIHSNELCECVILFLALREVFSQVYGP